MAGKCWDKRVDHAPCGMAPQPLGLPVIRPLSAAPDAACVEHNGPRPGAAQDKPEKREREREREREKERETLEQAGMRMMSSEQKQDVLAKMSRNMPHPSIG